MRARLLAVLAAGAALALTGATAPAAGAADPELLLVHGYGSPSNPKDCNAGTWEDALRYFHDAGGRARESMSTVGYYNTDRNCDVTIGDGRAGTDRPIQVIAMDLAHHVYDDHTSEGKSVDIVAHSMGGLVTRVALLGSAQGWEGFPPKLDVDNVVTLSTPHQGVIDAADAPDTHQWRQMTPGSRFLERLHEAGSEIDDGWANGTDWTFVGSAEDGTVSYASGIDKGNFADQKLGYRSNLHDAGDVTHSKIRTLHGENRYDLNYWHASGDHGSHNTLQGWAPLKTAFKAATNVGDDLPR